MDSILGFIIDTVFLVFGIALLVRAWAYAIRLHPFNSYSQAVTRLTDWLVQPIRKLVSPRGKLDLPSLLASWLTAFVYLLATFIVISGRLPVIQWLLPALIASLLITVKWALNLVVWMTLIQAILSWVNPMAPVMPVLQTLTAPLLNPIRRIMPNLGGIDFSPVVLLLLAQVAMMVVQRIAYSALLL